MQEGAPKQEHSIEGKCPSCGRMVPVEGDGEQYVIQPHEGCETSGVAVENPEDIMSA